MGKNAYIVGSYTFAQKGFSPTEGDFIIAADSGYLYLKQIHVVPDLIIGDFDSAPEPKDHPNVIILPKQKDDTDLFAAVRQGILHGCETFHIFGGMGGEIDHTLANIACLAYLSKRGHRNFLYGETTIITAITNGSIEFDEGRRGMISVFAYGGDAKGVSIHGLAYPLNNACLTVDYPLGARNQFIGKSASVSVEDGTLVIVYPNNNPEK